MSQKFDVKEGNNFQEEHKELLYSTMAKEASALYSQLLTISTAFLGGSLAFFDKLYVSQARWTLIMLYLSWIGFAISIAMLSYIRWLNVEAHRYALEYIKEKKEKSYKDLSEIVGKSRKLMKVVLLSLWSAMLLVGVFTAVNLLLAQD